MSPAKQEIIQLLETLPDDYTADELSYQLYFRRSVEAGMRDIEAGRVMSQEEVERGFQEWRESRGRSRGDSTST